MLRRKTLIFLLFILMPVLSLAQKVIPLYPNVALGSTDWNWQEHETILNAGKDIIVSNVVKPTLTVFQADPAKANGTAVVICPGGGYYILAMSSEGTEIAQWLSKLGITTFVLKYRLAHSITVNPWQEFLSTVGEPAKLTDIYAKIVPLAIADGKQALSYVRSHAAEYQINPDKIGVLGFSAGGGVAVGATFDYTIANKPNFVGALYPYVPPILGKVPSDAPPMFLAIASDDDFHLVPSAINLYNQWQSSSHSAELHIYQKGGHGFDLRKRNLPVDSWTDRFLDWLRTNGYYSDAK